MPLNFTCPPFKVFTTSALRGVSILFAPLSQHANRGRVLIGGSAWVSYHFGSNAPYPVRRSPKNIQNKSPSEDNNLKKCYYLFPVFSLMWIDSTVGDGLWFLLILALRLRRALGRVVFAAAWRYTSLPDSNKHHCRGHHGKNRYDNQLAKDVSRCFLKDTRHQGFRYCLRFLEENHCISHIFFDVSWKI